MSDIMKCNLCDFVTVRIGMANHLRIKHPKEYSEKPFSDDWATVVDSMTCAEFRELTLNLKG